MKKKTKYALTACACLMSLAALGQTKEETGMSKPMAFRHLDFSITAGTTGLGVDFATPISNVVKIRAGVSFMPHLSATMDFNLESGKFDEDGNWTDTKFEKLKDKFEEISGYALDDKVHMKGEPRFCNFHLLADVFPFHKKNWHFTAGFYVGPARVAKAVNITEDMISLVGVSVYNNLYDKVLNDEPLYDDVYLDPEIEQKILSYGRLGIYVGDKKADGTPYNMEPDEKSMVRAKIKVNAFRPYLGFGYGGNLLRHDDRFGISFDCGAMFWGGTPEIITHDGTNLSKEVNHIKGKVGNYVNAISAFKVYPVINVRFTRKLF